MRLSGVATHTATVVAAAQGKVRVVDTRKTTPGLRQLEKDAVRHGGGFNHRFGLFDGVMIKDNHIVAAGGIAHAIGRARARAPHTSKIECEVDSLAQLTQAHPPKRLGGDFRFSYHSVSARARVVASGLFVARIKQWVRHPVKARLLFGLSANLCRRRAPITYAGGHAGLRACGARPGRHRPSADELNFPDRTVFPDFKRSRVRDGTIRIDESALLF
jgi:hypothetical protein